MSFVPSKSNYSLILPNALAVALSIVTAVAPFTAQADTGTNSPFLSGPDSFTLKSFLESDAPLTFMGITLYGTIDIGMNGENHGPAYNPDFPTTVGEMLQKNSNKSTFHYMSNGNEQSSVGIKGAEELMPGLSLVFRLETGFNPTSMHLSSAQTALIDNPGQSFTPGSSIMGDSSRAGQYFEGQAYAGIDATALGSVTYGWQKTPLNELITKYDPQGPAYAFSPIENSGAVQGGGFTENARMKQAIKYNVKYGLVRFAAIYQIPNNINITGGDDAYQINLGADYAGLTTDILFGKKNDGVNITAAPSGASPYMLTPIVADITSFGFMAKYDLKEIVPVKVMAGYEHDLLKNPKSPLSLTNLAENSLADYAFAAPNDTNYNTSEVFHALWFGAQYAITPELSLNSAYYMYITENYSGMTQDACMTGTGSGKGYNHGHCAGSEEFASISLDYRFNKRFDVYAGTMYNRINDGMYVNNSYLHNNAISTTGGVRFKF